MTQRFLAVGDIHGCLDQLDEVLAWARSFPHHRLVFLGDYIDRGPDSEGVIRRLRELDAVFLMGNHEEMFPSRLELGDRAEVYRVAGLSRESEEWLRGLKPFYETEDYFFVHAGLDPRKPLSEQTQRDFLWYIHDGDYSGLTNKLVVHGHLVVPAPVRVGNRLNINTGCGSGGPLTAVALPERAFFHSSRSPGRERNWERIRREIEGEVEEL